MKLRLILLTCFSFVLLCSMALSQQQTEPNKLAQIEQSLKDDIPRILCLNEDVATGGQPTEQAFGKLAASGFRSVLNLRTASEGVDLEKEWKSVVQAGMTYINIPIPSNAPEARHVEEFIKAVKDKANHPMLIHCGSANRVGAFWMIYRVLEEGESEDQALKEAEKIGLTNPTLKEFAQTYISQHKPKQSKTESTDSGEVKVTRIAEIKQKAEQFGDTDKFVSWLEKQKDVTNVSVNKMTFLTSDPPQHVVSFLLDGVQQKVHLVVDVKTTVIKVPEKKATKQK